VSVRYAQEARVRVAGRLYRLEHGGGCVWITGDLFTGRVEAVELEDATAVLANELRRRGAEERDR
jgi:hypothetical protein